MVTRMKGWCRRYLSLFLVSVITARNDTGLYTHMDCLVGDTFLAVVETLSRIRCAFHCMEQDSAGFSYDSQTRECHIFNEVFKHHTPCGEYPNVYGIRKVASEECSTAALLYSGNNTIEQPIKGDNAMSTYRCPSFNDPEPVNYCPVTRCEGGHWTPASLSCSDKDIFNIGMYPFEGRVTCTMKGETCQRWDIDTPHSVYFYRNRSDLHNWCQLRSERRPWCYTINTNRRWDYCPYSEVCNGPPPMVLLSGISVTTERSYIYVTSIVRYRCASLVDTVPEPSCPVTPCLPSERSWSTSNVSCSDKECYDPTTKVYNGRVACTSAGISCQRWDGDSPHTPSYNRGRSDFGNTCVIDGRKRPWCYTVDPLVPWDWCPVDECV